MSRGGAPRAVDLIVIGCSTGGPPALLDILPRLPAGTPTTVLVAQHMPARFTALFAGRLARRCALPVSEPDEAERLVPGRIYIAAGGRQTTIEKRERDVGFRVRPRARGERYAPSVDLLMEAAAAIYRRRLLGILMTGMGGDGVRGLRAIKAHKGMTLAESEETAVVFGMPGEAIRAGLADEVLPRAAIGTAMARLCRPPAGGAR